jgi:hypothetical protein
VTVDSPLGPKPASRTLRVPARRSFQLNPDSGESTGTAACAPALIGASGCVAVR